MPPSSATSGSTTSNSRRRYFRKAASRRRRGCAAALATGCSGGLAFCSTGNFSTGSAIALLLFVGFFVGALDGVADVFLDGLELREQAMRVRRTDALQRGR